MYSTVALSMGANDFSIEKDVHFLSGIAEGKSEHRYLRGRAAEILGVLYCNLRADIGKAAEYFREAIRLVEKLSEEDRRMPVTAPIANDQTPVLTTIGVAADFIRRSCQRSIADLDHG